MGGTRFSHLGETVRVDRATHDALAATVASRLAPHGVAAVPLPAMRGKEDFGDVDLMAPASGTHAGLPADSGGRVMALEAADARLAAAVGAVAHHRGQIRNPTLHMLVEAAGGLVQIDLTSVEDDGFDFAHRHLSWGDAGSIAVVVARQMGLVMGMNGIRIARPTPHGDADAWLDLDYGRALELIGYDAERHEAGFDRIEDVFRWLADGRYFDPRLWTPEWRTNKSRARGAKRPTYVAWMEWMARERPAAAYDWGDRRYARRDEWTARLLEAFPDAETALRASERRLAAPNATPLRAFFNATTVAEASGVDGRRLPLLMEAIRKDLGREELVRMAADDDGGALAAAARRLAPTIA